MTAAEILSLLVDRVRAHIAAYGDDDDHYDDIVPTVEEIARWSSETGLDHDAFLDQFALALAREYDAGDLSFEIGDWIVNDFYGYLSYEDLPSPKVFWCVFEAFDMGEHSHHGTSEDPENDYTRPLIRELLSQDG